MNLNGVTTDPADPAMRGAAKGGPCAERWFFLLTSNAFSFSLLFSSASRYRMLVIRSVAAHGSLRACGPWTVAAATHQLAALFNCLVLLPNFLSKCNTLGLQLGLLRYNTTLNAFGKSEFHLVGYIYSITRAQRAAAQPRLQSWGFSSLV